MQAQLPHFTSVGYFPELAELYRKRQDLSTSILAANTHSAYEHDWKLFTAWCSRVGHDPLPASADTVSLFLTNQLLHGVKVVTARRRFYAISHRHRIRGIELENRFEAIMLLRSAQRQRRERPRRARPLTVNELQKICEALASECTPLAIRNRAILLIGFASALRRSSLTALTLDDIEFTCEGVILTVIREKQDQEAKGRYIAIPHGKHEKTCAVKALRSWLAIRAETPDRQVFLCLAKGRQQSGLKPEHIAEVVKGGIRLIGGDPRNYSAHSLRAGLITAAGEEGLSDLMIAEQSGHRDMDVLRSYLRRTKLFRANACAALDL
jgi:site-specific recombinase XerD